jgi:hypothetical protein
MNSVFEIKSTFQEWRSVVLIDDNRRKGLRSTCRAEQKQTDTELEIAIHIISNPTSYARLKGLSSVSDQAHR